MNEKEIKERLMSLKPIDELNPMQVAAVASEAAALAIIAPTGSGKTLAFVGRMLRVIRPEAKGLQAVVITPSRELVLQVESVVRQVASGMKAIACYGGHSMRQETSSIEGEMPAVIVATPGRLLDHLQRGTLARVAPRALVLDEYDKSLELGFAGEMSRIVRRLGVVPQVTLTSATRLDEMPSYMADLHPEVIDFTDIADDPGRRMAVVGVESPARDKLQTLVDLLDSLPRERTIVFVNHRESAERVYEAVRRHGVAATLYHGGLEQEVRQTAVDMLANGSAPVMIATDLAARGLDIDGLSNIVHYHLPTSRQAWTHRNGRTARQNATGTVFVITSEADTVPDYVVTDRPLSPRPRTDADVAPRLVSLRFDAGRKEKISRGDIVGFLTANTSIPASEIGLISLHDHYTIVAVPAAAADEAEKVSQTARLKGKKVRAKVVRQFGLWK